MSEKRVSNETLGKVIVQVVKDLEKNLKISEKAQIQNQEVLNEISKNISKGLHQEVNRLNSFSIDLSPLDDKTNNYLNEIKRVSEDARKELKSPVLGFKVLGLFLGLFIATLSCFYFFNEQAKELKKERADKEYIIDFIKADKNRINDYKNWSESR